MNPTWNFLQIKWTTTSSPGSSRYGGRQNEKTLGTTLTKQNLVTWYKMTFAGNVILILSPLDSGVKYYTKPGWGGRGATYEIKNRSASLAFYFSCFALQFMLLGTIQTPADFSRPWKMVSHQTFYSWCAMCSIIFVSSIVVWNSWSTDALLR